MSENCGNCKYWGTTSEIQQTFTYRTCQAIKHDNNGATADWRQECKVYKDQEGFEDLYDDYLEGMESLEDQKAVCCDGDGYSACLRTTEFFGCILFERKT